MKRVPIEETYGYVKPGVGGGGGGSGRTGGGAGGEGWTGKRSVWRPILVSRASLLSRSLALPGFKRGLILFGRRPYS